MRVFLAVVICLAMTSGVLGGEPALQIPKIMTARGFVDYYRTPGEHDLARAYIRGIIAGLGDADAKVRTEDGHPLFCWPEKLAIVEDQLVSIVFHALEAHPKLGEVPFSTAAMLALADEFPCKKS